MDPLFEVHMLNDEGKRKAAQIANDFEVLLMGLGSLCQEGRSFSQCKTFLEMAAFYAKKSMASMKENQQ